MELKCFVQKYDWGKTGSQSTVARLAAMNNGEDINENTPYAEFWMGVHPSGPSRIASSNELLFNYLSKNAETLGENVINTFGSSLPFLFKVLSVQKALSIQAHPAKAHAEELFAKFPDVYKDSNHKPELAIALTRFEALCGFRPRREIVQAFQNIPELRSLIGEDRISAFVNGQDSIRNSFEALMTCDPKILNTVIISLKKEDSSEEKKLIRRLSEQFPGDVGALCVYWLNYIVLEPGEALFLAPNEPHAYLYGDCVECMANSDNVVRAGLTPKFRDVSTLCNMLTYKSHAPSDIKFQPEVENEFSLLFRPPVKDFAVAKITIPASMKYALKPRSSASILLVISGESEAVGSNGTIQLITGVVLFIPAEYSLEVCGKSEQLLFQAMCNI